MRETKELKTAITRAITGTRFSVKQEYSKAILDLIVYNLNEYGKVYIVNITINKSYFFEIKDGIKTVIDIMEHYNLTPEIVKEHLVNLQSGKRKDLFDEIPTQIKSALTRTYNQRHKSSLKKVSKGRKAGNLFINYMYYLHMIS